MNSNFFVSRRLLIKISFSLSLISFTTLNFQLKGQDGQQQWKADFETCFDLIDLERSNYEIIPCLEVLLDKYCESGFLSDSILARTHSVLMYRYAEKGTFEIALFHAKASLYHTEHFYNYQSIEAINSWHSLAFLYETSFGNSGEAILIRKKILRICDAALAESYDAEVASIKLNTLTRLGSKYQTQGKIKEALAFFLQAKALLSDDISAPKKFAFLLLYSDFLLQIGKHEEAFQIMSSEKEKILTMPKPDWPIRDIFFIDVLLVQIHLAYDSPSLIKAKQLLREAEELKALDFVLSYHEQLYLYKAKIQVATAAEEFDLSDEYAKTAIALMEEHNRAYYNQWNVLTISEFYELRAANKQQAYSVSQQQKDDLLQAYAYAEEAVNQLKIALRSFENRNDQQFHLSEYFAAFERINSILYDLYQTTGEERYFIQALENVNQSKNVFLTDHLRRYQVAEKLGVPEYYFEQEKELTSLIYRLESEKNSAEENSTLSKERFIQISDSLLLLQGALSTLNNDIKANYPQYFEQLTLTETIDINKLKQNLSATDQTLLQYTVSDDELFLFVVNANTQSMFKIDLSLDSINSLVNTYREQVYQVQQMNSGTHQQKLQQISYELYQIFLSPAQELLTSNLLIAPDGPLEMLPFSALVSGEKANSPMHQWTYLLKDYNIRYTYFIDPAISQKKEYQNKFNKVLAFAPDFADVYLAAQTRSAVGALVNNQDEVNYIEHNVSTKAFYGPNASLASFLAYANQYRVIHLATHAVANEEFGNRSYLLFSDQGVEEKNKLDVGQIYAMQIPADLVVLSACETSIGEWQRGEGLIGLERAFAHAGAKSLISTKWKVSDKESSKLMSFFYDYLKQGYEKDQALQQAKIQFIEENPHRAHPFFWAAYVLTGESGSVTLSSNHQFWWYLFGGLILILAGAGYRKRKLKA